MMQMLCYDYTNYVVHVQRKMLYSLNRLYGPQQSRLESTWLRCMGEALQLSMYRFPISNVEIWWWWRFKDSWENLDQSIDQWHDRLKAVVQVNGGQSKQLFWLSGSFAFAAMLLCIVCILRTCMYSTIVYRLLLYYCDRK